MAQKKFAAATKLEVRGRVIAPGEIVDEGDFEPEDGLDELLDSGALEAFDKDEHADGWYDRRYARELDRVTVKAGGLPRAEVDNEVRANDVGTGTTKGR